jgi:hypothetical protein
MLLHVLLYAHQRCLQAIGSAQVALQLHDT